MNKKTQNQQLARVEEFIGHISSHQESEENVILLDAEMDASGAYEIIYNEVCVNSVVGQCSPNSQKCFNSIEACVGHPTLNQQICDSPQPVVSMEGCTN